MLNSGKKNALSEKKILNETKNHNPPPPPPPLPLQVKMVGPLYKFKKRSKFQ